MKRLLLLLLLATVCYSAIAVNSLDGRDVVSGAYYGAVTGERVVFVPPAYDLQNVYAKVGTGEKILLVQSEANPVIIGMADTLRTRGNTVEVLTSTDPYQTNLELAKRSNAQKFILVDPAYGYNTVSTLAYAKLNSMYLIFVDKDNMAPVVSFLATKRPSDILIYGYLDSDVKNALKEKSLNYREINNGDKFDDNMALLDIYLQQSPAKKQVILSDGNSLEDTIIEGNDPVLLISPVVPTAVYNYVKDKAAKDQIAVCLVVDQEYAQTAYNLKTSVNKELGTDKLHVLVKFGQSTTGAGTGMIQPPLFPLRGPLVGLTIEKAEYNTAKKQLEVTYVNTGNVQQYVKSQVAVFVDGAFVKTVGDEMPFVIGRGEKLGKGYAIEIQEGEISTNITAFFGASNKNLENGIQQVIGAGRVDFVDTSALNVTDFTQDGADLLVTFKNTGKVPVYFRPDATIQLNGQSTKIDEGNIYTLAAGEGRIVKFPGIVKSGSITAGANYGAREAFLEKRADKTYAPSGLQIDMTLILAGVIILLLIIVVAYLMMKKK